MKALTLTNPWATLMAHGEKVFETRGPTFQRRHLGDLAIVSSGSWIIRLPGQPPFDCRTLLKQQPFSDVLMRHLSDEYGAVRNGAFPLSAVLCVVEVVGYARAEDVGPSSVHAHCYSWRSRNGDVLVKPAAHEKDFGGYDAGRVIIATRNLRKLVVPVPVERIQKGQPKAGGALGIYDISPACEAAVLAQLPPQSKGT